MGGEGKGACFENCPKSGGEWNSCGVTSAWARIWAICRVTLTADPPAFVRNGSFGTLNSYNSILSLSSPENVFQPRTEIRRRFFFPLFLARNTNSSLDDSSSSSPLLRSKIRGGGGGRELGAKKSLRRAGETDSRDNFHPFISDVSSSGGEGREEKSAKGRQKVSRNEG